MLFDISNNDFILGEEDVHNIYKTHFGFATQ